jgi:hypothetical protein
LLLRPSVVSGKSFDDFAASKLSREQWAQRVDEARCRLEEFVANTRIQGMTSRPSADHQKTEAVERAMRNPSLLRGDIVATGKGFVIFTGRGERKRPCDFVAAPSQKGLGEVYGVRPRLSPDHQP